MTMTPSCFGDISRADLFTHPPFATRADASRVNTEGVEFSGVFGTGDDAEVSLAETGGKHAAWVRLRDAAAPYYVENIADDGSAITVRLDGRRVKVPLRKESGESSRAGRDKPEIFVRADGKEWSLPEAGEGRHPNDPGNAD